MEISIKKLEDLPAVAKAILQQHPDKKIFLLKGNMGAGKTTLVKQLCLALGVKENIQSPTFSLVNEYDSPNGKIYHFDFYRLENPKQADEIGVEEYFFSSCYCFIEWPDLITNFLPSNDKYTSIHIFVNQDQRTFQF